MTEPRPRATGTGLVEFLDMMRQMRAECAWKASQTHASLAQYMTEEAGEAVEAIHEGDDEHLKEELGDVLIQIYFHAVLAEERGAFTLDDVVEGLRQKMIRRNPHVFGDLRGTNPSIEETNEIWQRVKEQEEAQGLRRS
jgi:uncharacterized protein YabN with tetrapyrrole methylase and pyrophosphatase domain